MMARTTPDIDTPILRDLKKIQKSENKSLGRVVSELLAEAIARHRDSTTRAEPLKGLRLP